LRIIRRLPRSQSDFNREAQTAHGYVVVNGKTALRLALRFLLSSSADTPFFAPEASWWARITVLSSISQSRSGSWSSWKTGSETPFLAQRSNPRHAVFHLPNRSSKFRQGAPVFAIQRNASPTGEQTIILGGGPPIAFPSRQTNLDLVQVVVGDLVKSLDRPYLAKLVQE